MKPVEKMTFEELGDWAAALLLKDLIAGHFRLGVLAVISTTLVWGDAHRKLKAKEKKK